jgi:serine/threonine protein kinase
VQRLGKYEILSEVGRGGMGVVYKARDTLIDRPVALKTISRNVAERADILARFYQEARSAGSLQHPNIVTIYELGEQDGAPFIAMEFLEGETLERLILRRAVLPLLMKLGYIVRVSEALSYAHKHGVIHRDIKPANVIVTTEGVVKVVDFGIARVADMAVTQANSVIGSRGYMAPQLYSGERADARSDIWSLGVTSYELLTYQRPFVAESEAELMFKVLHEEPLPLRALSPDCPELLENVVKRMLQKSVSARFQNVMDVIHELGPLWKQVQADAVQEFLAESRQLIDIGNLHSARDLLNRTLQIDITSTAAKSLLERVSVEIRLLETVPRINENLNRARQYLSAGKLVEARGEVELALGLDSQHKPTQQLRGEIEVATKAAQQLEQQLRLASERLSQGALTEVEEMLKNVPSAGAPDDRVERLKRQVLEERTRRERRRRFSEFVQRARGLWLELKHEECLRMVKEALGEFPGEKELLDLQAAASEDWVEQEKQKRVEQARKLLGQQRFVEAREVLETWANQHGFDSRLKNLRALIQQGEDEQQRRMRMERELSTLRELAARGKYADAVTKGEALLLEYPQEFELKEVVGYAKGELAQNQKREEEQQPEKHVQSLLKAGRYAEAAAAAGARNRTDLKLDAVQALVSRGRYDEATLMLNDAFATQILQPSHPRANYLLTQIAKMPRALPSQSNQAAASIDVEPAQAAPAEPKQDVIRAAPWRKVNLANIRAVLKRHLAAAALGVKFWAAEAGPSLKRHLPPTGTLLTRRVMMTSVIALALVGTASIGIISLRSFRKAHLLLVTQTQLRDEAEQLWNQHEPDQAEAKWKQIEAVGGTLATRAKQEIESIEKKRSDEQQLFVVGERLLQQDKNNPQGHDDLQQVVDMQLWHAADAKSDLESIQPPQIGGDNSKQEQSLFDEGEQLFQKGNYDTSQRRFRDVLNLKIPNSALRPKAQTYLNKIRAMNDDKKNYDLALEDLQNENWDAANDSFRQIVDRKGPLAEEAKKELDKIASSQRAIVTVEEQIHAGSYIAAKNKLDAVSQWPKSFERLQQQLLAAEQQEFTSFRSRSQSLLKNQDVAGLERLQDELNIFSSRVQDSSVREAANALGSELNRQVPILKEQQSPDTAIFEKATRDFQRARTQGDIIRLKTDVLREFEQIVRMNGFHHDLAQQYVNGGIPDAIRELTQTLAGKGKAVVPPISCSHGQGAPPTSGTTETVPCTQLDGEPSLQWIGTPTIDVPSGAKQAGKLPYTLHLIVFVDTHGNAKRVDKDGQADQDFLKKAKDAARQWKTTEPKLNGKPVNASFPIEITFQP